MQSKFNVGDMVRVDRDCGLVIAVQPANSMPDAHLRGMTSMMRWSYWVLTCNANDRPTLVGPLVVGSLRPLLEYSLPGK